MTEEIMRDETDKIINQYDTCLSVTGGKNAESSKIHSK